MFMGLQSPLKTGSTVSVTLTFAKAGDVVVDVPVLEEAP
jgi:copper(I)-binding protein